MNTAFPITLHHQSSSMVSWGRQISLFTLVQFPVLCVCFNVICIGLSAGVHSRALSRRPLTVRGSCCLYGSGHEVLLTSRVLYHTSRSPPVPCCWPLGRGLGRDLLLHCPQLSPYFNIPIMLAGLMFMSL